MTFITLKWTFVTTLFGQNILALGWSVRGRLKLWPKLKLLLFKLEAKITDSLN